MVPGVSLDPFLMYFVISGRRYAMRNRGFMRDIMIDCVNEVTGHEPDLTRSVNIHHNFCQCERCKYKDPKTKETIEKDLWVTRKGATSAQAGEYGTGSLECASSNNSPALFRHHSRQHGDRIVHHKGKGRATGVELLLAWRRKEDVTNQGLQGCGTGRAQTPVYYTPRRKRVYRPILRK